MGKARKKIPNQKNEWQNCYFFKKRGIAKATVTCWALPIFFFVMKNRNRERKALYEFPPRFFKLDCIHCVSQSSVPFWKLIFFCFLPNFLLFFCIFLSTSYGECHICFLRQWNLFSFSNSLCFLSGCLRKTRQPTRCTSQGIFEWNFLKLKSLERSTPRHAHTHEGRYFIHIHSTARSHRSNRPRFHQRNTSRWGIKTLDEKTGGDKLWLNYKHRCYGPLNGARHAEHLDRRRVYSFLPRLTNPCLRFTGRFLSLSQDHNHATIQRTK